MTFEELVNALDVCPTCGSKMYMLILSGDRFVLCWSGCRGYFKLTETNGNWTVEYTLIPDVKITQARL